jgi:hypothetical protein
LPRARHRDAQSEEQKEARAVPHRKPVCESRVSGASRSGAAARSNLS